MLLTGAALKTQCVSTEFAVRRSLATAISCGYPELQRKRKKILSSYPAASLVTYFEPHNNRFVCLSVTDQRYC